MHPDIDLPCILVLCGDPACSPASHATGCEQLVMAGAFLAPADVAYEAARLSTQAWRPAAPDFASFSEALRFVAGPHEHVVVSRSRWTADTATHVGRLLGEAARLALLRLAQDLGWPMHGQVLPEMTPGLEVQAPAQPGRPH
ncbi:MAG: hypothetical protein ACKOSS_05615 [Planctomycetia bacterium]